MVFSVPHIQKLSYPKTQLLFANETKHLQIFENKVYYNNDLLVRVKFVGTPITTKQKYIQVLDPFGIIEIYKSQEDDLKGMPYILYCNVFVSDNKIVFYLYKHFQINLYEKICIIQNHINNKNKY